MKYNVGVMDVVSMSALHDTIIVLPTLKHAIALWRMYRFAIWEAHEGRIRTTKTAVAMPLTRTLLRLWVPYEREATMPMDWEPNRRGFDLVTPYGRGA